MAHVEIQFWTFTGLVGAFLDLSIAYLFLCISTLAYFASKFLGLFGLRLPCPRNGLFGGPEKNQCFQGIIANCSSEKISSVQCSIKNKFPFDLLLASDPKLRLVKEEFYDNQDSEFRDEASCSFFTARESEDVVSKYQDLSDDTDVGVVQISSPVMKEGKSEVREKGSRTRRTRHGLRLRRKGVVHEKGVSCNDSSPHESQASSLSFSSFTRMGGGYAIEKSYVTPNSEDGREVLGGERASQQRISCSFNKDETDSDNKPQEKAGSPFKELKCNSRTNLVVDSDAQTTVRILEQALEEEQTAGASLFLELEKERSAAATAVDEAMAMILRLQREKALIEMESRQNQRMMDAKSAYDAEEMKILKEILLRRERENNFLEKEVEAYRQMFLDNECIESYRQDTTTSQTQGDYLLYSREDQLVLQHQISESFDDVENVKELNNFKESGTTFFETENNGVAFGKELPIPELTDDMDYLVVSESHMDPVIDKNLLTFPAGNGVTGHSFNKNNPRNQLDELLSLDKTMILEQEELEQTDNSSSCQRLALNPTQNCDDATIIAYDDGLENNKNSSISSSYGIETPVHDVHVIHDDVKIDAQLGGNETEFTQANLNLPRACDSPTLGRLKSKLERNRCSLDVASRLPPLRGPRVKALSSDMRRNSMSQFDYERLKIDNEVVCLRERLRVVQEGKMMLNFSPGHREREKGKPLENISSQLREIQELTEPGKSVGKASFPLQFSKVEVMSKKRCWRSASLQL